MKRDRIGVVKNNKGQYLKLNKFQYTANIKAAGTWPLKYSVELAQAEQNIATAYRGTKYHRPEKEGAHSVEVDIIEVTNATNS